MSGGSGSHGYPSLVDVDSRLRSVVVQGIELSRLDQATSRNYPLAGKYRLRSPVMSHSHPTAWPRRLSARLSMHALGTQVRTPHALQSWHEVRSDDCFHVGAYHSGVPGEAVDDSLLSGCALGIADVDDISRATWDNLAIFSVQSNCVKQKVTSFEVRSLCNHMRGSELIPVQLDSKSHACMHECQRKLYLWLVRLPQFILKRAKLLLRQLSTGFG